ncbi:MAG: VWA domain-containing protein, partial [Planctomycetaceae bacterium]|nr:VWA domain-containing protein [Planctomycetaceae bacterium]
MLSFPYALIALMSLPVVFGIYFFRTRSVRYEVSALFLWYNRQRAEQGGRKIQRLKLPLLILLELLALTLLSIAAAQPLFRKEQFGSPTIVILDDSYSMTAGFNGDTSQQRAKNELHRMLENQIGYPVQFITAGNKPHLIAGRAKNSAEARNILDKWQCGSETANLAEALTFAINLSLSSTKILVITDSLPDGKMMDGKVLWKSFGKALDNFAVVYSSRTFQEERDRLLLEIGNYSAKEQLLRMNILEPERKKILFRGEKLVPAGDIHRILTELPQGTGDLEIRLADDALAIDNVLTIPPGRNKPLRVQVQNVPPELRPRLEKALLASGLARLTDNEPELIFITNASRMAAATPMTVQIISPTKDESVKSFIGPYILENHHLITKGLDLDGVVWGGSSTVNLNGIPVISAGDIPLLTEQIRRGGEVVLTMQLNESLSTLTSSPAFPILVWNILKYCSANRELMFAAQDTRSLTPLISAEESDLRNCFTRTSGNWLDEETIR